MNFLPFEIYSQIILFDDAEGWPRRKDKINLMYFKLVKSLKVLFRRIVGGIHSSQPDGFIFRSFGRTSNFWRLVFGEEPLPPVVGDEDCIRIRARSNGGAGSDSAGPFLIPDLSSEDYLERYKLRALQFG